MESIARGGNGPPPSAGHRLLVDRRAHTAVCVPQFACPISSAPLPANNFNTFPPKLSLIEAFLSDFHEPNSQEGEILSLAGALFL